jgi:hypothetical protein
MENIERHKRGGRPPLGIKTKLIRIMIAAEADIRRVDREHRARFLAEKAQREGKS